VGLHLVVIEERKIDRGRENRDDKHREANHEGGRVWAVFRPVLVPTHGEWRRRICIRRWRIVAMWQDALQRCLIVSGKGRSKACSTDGECYCAPGTILRSRLGTVLGLGIRGSARRRARAAEKCIHDIKESVLWVNGGVPDQQAMTFIRAQRGPRGRRCWCGVLLGRTVR
jgi:hypothetical protein